MDSDLKSPENGLSPIPPAKPEVSLPAVPTSVDLPPLRKLLASLPQIGQPQPPKTRWSSLPPLAPKPANSPAVPKPVNSSAVPKPVNSPAPLAPRKLLPPLAPRTSLPPLAPLPRTSYSGIKAAVTRPGILNKITQGNTIFYGYPLFINKCITEFEVIEKDERAYGKKTGMSGAFGKVHKINIDGVDYFVKKITYDASTIKKPSIFRNTIPDGAIELEIEAAIDLTIRIPAFVSNLKGAYYKIEVLSEKYHINTYTGYLIFEAQPGMNLYEFIKKNPPTSSNKDMYNDLYIKIKRAQKALNAAGYVHQDIKPLNIYVETNVDGTPKNCKLIDFGLTRPIGSEFDGSGTPRYMSKATYLEHARTGKISPLQNNTSVKIIWDLDFKRENELPPIVRGGSRKNRNKTKKRKNTSRKIRSS